jgi:L-2,4-diaminobutyrate decarboxylase
MGFTEDCALTARALQGFRERSRERVGRVIHQPPMAGLAEELGIDRWIAQGGLQGPALAGFLETYLGASTRLHSPRYMAHQVATPHPSGALGALVDGFLNNGPVLYEMGPAGAAVDYLLLNWMLGKVGWEPAPLPGRGDLDGAHGGGALVHGGSLANLTALMAARGAAAPDAWRDGMPADLVLVAPEACHYSIGRAADLLGLGRGRLLAPPTDADGRILAAQLPGFLRGLRERGRRVLALVANACSTPAGLFDPLRAVGEACREAGVWLHVDGAHGASALVSSRLRGLLDGVELADSLVWDAHKMLRAPIVCAAVLARDGRRLDQAFHQEASYLFHDKEQPGVDLIHRSVECTKGGLGLRAFLALAAEGEPAMAAYLERQTALARAAAEQIAARPGFELAVAPPFNIVCFRLDGPDELQLELRKRLLEAGEFYITTTQFRGRRWLRLTLINPETEPEDVRALLAELERLRRANATGMQL